MTHDILWNMDYEYAIEIQRVIPKTLCVTLDHRSKTKRVKQALQGQMMEIKLAQGGLEATPKWVTLGMACWISINLTICVFLPPFGN